MTVLQRNLKEWQEWLWTHIYECQRKTTKVGRQLECQEQCIDHVPYYLLGLSRAHFFSTTSLEIAAYSWQLQGGKTK